ncbi:2-keto-3-deoxy-D-glycero-D-galacto-9-phosphonononic acid phosphatase [subsurface metagenome]
MLGIETDFDRIKFNYKNIDLIVYDFDGVMTDNRVIIFQDGTEAVIVNRSDGLGVERFRSLGIPQLILSTETNHVVKARAAKLHLEVIASCKDKKNVLKKYCKKMKYNLSKVAYIGNDINDLEAMKIVGYPIAPANAHAEVKKIAKIITKTIGGDGVIRELFDIFMEDKL